MDGVRKRWRAGKRIGKGELSLPLIKYVVNRTWSLIRVYPCVNSGYLADETETRGTTRLTSCSGAPVSMLTVCSQATSPVFDVARLTAQPSDVQLAGVTARADCTTLRSSITQNVA